MKLLGLFLIRCVFTKKILGCQKFVKTGTGKNRGFSEHCVAMSELVLMTLKTVYVFNSIAFGLNNIVSFVQIMS